MTPTPRRAPFAGLLAAAFALNCGSRGGNGYTLDVGADDGGPSFVEGSGDAGASAAFDAHIEQNHITVTFVTVSCTGPCADVVAVPTGGQAPYTFEWDDGLTSAARHVCSTSSTNYDVKVTDTGTSGEFARPAETVQVPLEAKAIACPDGGIPHVACDGGDASPLAGTYSGSYTTAALSGQTGSISLTLANGSGSQLSGSFAASLFAALQNTGSFAGDVDCSTGTIVVSGPSSDGKSYVYEMTYDASTRTLSGTWEYTYICPPVCTGQDGGVGDHGTFTATWSGP